MGRRAYGWTADDSELIDPEAAELRRVAREIDAGKSRKQIVRELNDRSEPTSSGNEWSVTALSRMLKNPRMIGRKADSLGRPIMQGPMIYPPVFVTPDEVALWKRVRAKLTDPKLKQAKQTAASLLSDHAVCGLCRNGMYPSRPKRRRPRYACHVSSGCGRMSIQAHLAEEYVGHEVVKHAAEVVPGVTEVSAAAWWTAADLDAKRELLAGLLESVAVMPVSPGKAGVGRLVLTWKDMPSWPASLVSGVRGAPVS